MPANPLIFKDADEAVKSIMEQQKKDIARMYSKWADEIGDMAKYYAGKTNKSSFVSEQQMKELKKQLMATSKQLSLEVKDKIISNLYITADSVIKSNASWLSKIGFEQGKTFSATMSSVQSNIVNNVITGQIYDSGWSLSSRIWGNNNETLRDIYGVVAKGMAQNRPIYDIAKNLEAYVRPGATMPWNLEVGGGLKIYKKQVDYNAQRLARTLVQHGYQQSFKAVTEKNPFITDYIWLSNGSRVCPLCKARDGAHFKKSELPLDHPNGMCTMVPNVVNNLEDKLADWFNSPDGTYPDVDSFAKNFGYVPSSKTPPKTQPKTPVKTETKQPVKPKTPKVVKPENTPGTKEYLEKKLGTKVKKGLKMTDSIWDDFTQGMIDNVDTDMQKAWGKYMVKFKGFKHTAEDEAFYSPFNKTITMNLSGELNQAIAYKLENKFDVLYHELGHFFDSNIDLPDIFGKVSASDRYMNQFIKDLENFKLKYGKDPEFTVTVNGLKDDHNSKGLQDVIGAFKHVKEVDGLPDLKYMFKWSHSDEYWTRNIVEKEMTSELFAHQMTAVASPKVKEYMEILFPNTFKEFNMIFKDSLKRVKK